MTPSLSQTDQISLWDQFRKWTSNTIITKAKNHPDLLIQLVKTALPENKPIYPLAKKIIKCLKQVSLPDRIASQFYEALGRAKILNERQRTFHLACQPKHIMSFEECCVLGDDDLVLERIRQGIQIPESLSGKAASTLLFILCKNPDPKEQPVLDAIRKLITMDLNKDNALIIRKDSLGKTPFHYFLENKGNLAKLVLSLPFKFKKELEDSLISSAYVEVNEYLIFLSLKKGQERFFMQDDFTYVPDDLIIACAQYVNEWLVSDISKAKIDPVHLNLLISSLGKFSINQQRDFVENLKDELAKDIVRQSYCEHYSEKLQEIKDFVNTFAPTVFSYGIQESIQSHETLELILKILERLRFLSIWTPDKANEEKSKKLKAIYVSISGKMTKSTNNSAQEPTCEVNLKVVHHPEMYKVKWEEMDECLKFLTFENPDLLNNPEIDYDRIYECLYKSFSEDQKFLESYDAKVDKSEWREELKASLRTHIKNVIIDSMIFDLDGLIEVSINSRVREPISKRRRTQPPALLIEG